jgi:predicted unusual protein kinase regulating ubiquinone biosynthesis (AarF/ABC1/UbiB family)
VSEMQAITKCLRHDLNTLEDWIRQIAEFKKIMAESICQITKFKKTINESLDYMAEAEKAIAKIVGFLGDKYTNKNQFAYRASQ